MSPDHTASSGRVISSTASTSSIMGLDAVTPPPSVHESVERTALLDVERGPEYGSLSSSSLKGDYIELFLLQVLKCN